MIYCACKNPQINCLWSPVSKPPKLKPAATTFLVNSMTSIYFYLSSSRTILGNGSVLVISSMHFFVSRLLKNDFLKISTSICSSSYNDTREAFLKMNLILKALSFLKLISHQNSLFLIISACSSTSSVNILLVLFKLLMVSLLIRSSNWSWSSSLIHYPSTLMSCSSLIQVKARIFEKSILFRLLGMIISLSNCRTNSLFSVTLSNFIFGINKC